MIAKGCISKLGGRCTSSFVARRRSLSTLSNKRVDFENEQFIIKRSSYQFDLHQTNTTWSIHRYFSTNAEFTKSEYIHPLSQIVLEHLQTTHSNFLQYSRLSTGLTINKDGTFVLRFPNSTNESDIDSDDSGAPHESIWTIYESEEKKHYLCINKGGLVGRYMLQDNQKPAWHSDKRSTPERVQDAVDQMIDKLQE